jgi:hypothetical protein
MLGRDRDRDRDRDPTRLGTFEKLGAWLGIWTPPRDAVLPPPPSRRTIAIAAFVAVALAAGAAALVVPPIQRGKAQRAAAAKRRHDAAQVARRRRLAAEGRLHRGNGRRPGGRLTPSAQLRARRALVGDLERAITRDARARVRAGRLEGPVLATECEINPPSRRPVERDLDARGSDYDCLVVTRRDPDGHFSVGYTFDATVDYRRFEFTWRKACLVPGEGSARLTC